MNKTVERTVQILEYLARASKNGGVGISAVSREFDIPKSSVSDILYSLLELGFIEYENEMMKTFKLGEGAVRFGLGALEQYDLKNIIHPELIKLHKQTGYTAFAGIRTDSDVTYIDKVEGASAIRFAIGAGSTRPLHLTAIGKALLAGFDNDSVIDIMGDSCYVTHTSNSICNVRRLLREMDKVRKNGYALENFEDNDYTYSIAAPIFDIKNKVCAAVCISLLASDITEEQIAELTHTVSSAAKRISESLGCTKYGY